MPELKCAVLNCNKKAVKKLPIDSIHGDDPYMLCKYHYNSLVKPRKINLSEGKQKKVVRRSLHDQIKKHADHEVKQYVSDTEKQARESIHLFLSYAKSCEKWIILFSNIAFFSIAWIVYQALK